MTNNPNTVIAAVLAWLGAIVTGVVTLLTVPGIKELADVPTVTWVILLAGATGTFFQHLYAIATRAGLRKVTRSPLAPSKYYPQPTEDSDAK
jgi:Na+/phosphate symporter